MERYLRQLRNRLQGDLDLRGLGSVLLVAVLAGCSSSGSPDASGGSGGGAGSVAPTGGSGNGGQTSAGGTTSLAGATVTGGSNASGGVTAGGSTATSSGGLAAAGTTAQGGTTGGMTSSGGNASGGVSSAGGISSAGGTVKTGGTPSTGGTTAAGGTAATGGATSTAGNSATGGSTRTGGATSTGGNSATGGSTRTGGATSTGGTATGGATSTGGTAIGGATSTAGTTSACGASGATYDTSAVTTSCTSAATGPAVPAGITSAYCTCVNEGGPSYKTGIFTVANNVWGTGPGPECVWATTSTLWGVTANHPQTSGVKSYPNIGYSPKKLISSINTYTSSFDITVPGNVGSWEAAYDMWVKAPTGNTRIELMVWMYTYQTGPISSVVATTKPAIGDYIWTVHYGSNGSNATISLVNTSPSTGKTANVTSGTIDVKGILDWLIANNTTQYGQFDNTWTLDQVQWGFEISGDGGSTQEFVNNCFSVSST